MADKKSLLFITTDVPWPADSGGKIKTFKLVEHLANRYQVRLLCAYGQSNPEGMKQLRATTQVESVQAFENHRPRTALNWLIALFNYSTFNAFRVYSKPMEAMIKFGIEAADIVVVDHLEMMDLIPEEFAGKVIYHSHNAEFKLWKSYAEVQKNPFIRLLIQLEARRVFVFEKWVLRNAALSFVSPPDLASFKESMDIDTGRMALTYHLGHDEWLSNPAIDVAANEDTVFFGGTLDWVPNRDGLEWLLREVWPGVLKARPAARLLVCGKGADAELLNLMKGSSGVEYRGFVADLPSVMSECRVAIVPLRLGSGMKIKTLDAMYKGLPVVSTTEGVRGIDAEHNVDALISDTSGDFSDAILQLLENKEKARDLAVSARQLMTKRYTYPALFQSMDEAIENVGS